MKTLITALGIGLTVLASQSQTAHAQLWGRAGSCSRHTGSTAGWNSGYGSAYRTPYVAPYTATSRSSHIDVHYDRTPWGGAVPHAQRHTGSHNSRFGRW